jgi:hypothetical protein
MVLLAVAWLVTRFVLFEPTLHGTNAGGFGAGAQDVFTYQRWSQLIWSGGFPSTDANYQYPPGAALVFAVFGSDASSYFRRFTLGALLADLCVMVLLVVFAARATSGTWRGPWTWVLGGLLVGPIMLLRFDIFSTLLAVAAVLAATSPTWLGVFAGLGAVVKVWPGLALLAVPRQRLLRATITSAVTAVGVVLVLAILMPGSLDFIRNVGGRGLQIEAVAAWPFFAWHVLRPESWQLAYEYGGVDVGSAVAPTVATLSVLAGGALLVALVISRIRGRLEVVPGADVVLTAVLVFITFNKVNSPQFGVWLVGMAAVAMADRRSRMLPVVILIGLDVALTDRVISDGAGGLGALMLFDTEVILAQGLRILLLVAACAWALWLVLVRPANYATT